MKHVDRLLGKVEESDAGSKGQANVSLHISGSPNHIKSALKHLVHRKGSFGKKLSGQATDSIGGKNEPHLSGEKELGISHPHRVARAAKAKPPTDTGWDEKEGRGKPFKGNKYASGKQTDGEKEVGISHPHRVAKAHQESAAIALVDQLLEVTPDGEEAAE